MDSRYMRLLPEYAQDAFGVWYAYGANDEKCEAFAGTWGGVSLEHFLRALAQGQGDDRLCAMFGLGASMVPEARDALLPFLHSGRRDERCVSAIVLGICEDARAYPFLEKVLLEGLSLEERIEAFASQNQERMEEFWVCDRFRPRAAELLETWDSPTLVQTLTQALQALRVLEKASPRFGVERRVYGRLCYALGQRGALTALETLDFPPAYQRIAHVYLALGALHATPEPTFMRWVLKNENQMQFFLEEAFHLDEAHARYSIETFYQENEVRIAYQAGLDEQAIEKGLATHFMVPVSDHLMAFSVKQENDEPEMENGEPVAEAGQPETLEEEPVEEQEPVRICFNRGHTSGVWSVAWSPDGMHLVSGSEDHTAQVWNGRTGKQVQLFQGHTACVTAVAWSPDGQWVASGGCDNTVFVWHARTGEIVTTYTQHTAWICQSLAWSPDGTWIASASWDGTVQIWEALTGKTRLCYRGHHGVVTCAAWSPDGTQIVSGGGYPECAVHVWDANTGQRSVLYTGHMQDETGQRPALAEALAHDEEWVRGPSSLRNLAWSPDGRWIASAGLRNIFRVWDARTGEDLIAAAQNRTNGSLAWATDSSMVATGGRQCVDFWSLARRRMVLTYMPVSMYDVTALAWSPDGSALATAVDHPRIVVWHAPVYEG